MTYITNIEVATLTKVNKVIDKSIPYYILSSMNKMRINTKYNLHNSLTHILQNFDIEWLKGF
jgi:hypothetical protein